MNICMYGTTVSIKAEPVSPDPFFSIILRITLNGFLSFRGKSFLRKALIDLLRCGDIHLSDHQVLFRYRIHLYFLILLSPQI